MQIRYASKMAKVQSTKKGVVVSSISLSECIVFAVYENGIFGGKLTIDENGRKVQIKFLKSDTDDKFLDILNTIIANNIEAYVGSSYDFFNLYALTEYPRDSRLDLLSNFCGYVANAYNKQSELTEKYISSETFKRHSF